MSTLRDIFNRSALKKGVDRDLPLSSDSVLEFFLASSDLNAYLLGQTQIVQNARFTGVMPVASAESGPLKVTGGINDRVARVGIESRAQDIQTLAAVEFMVTNVDRTQSLHCFAQDVDISDIGVSGGALTSAHLGGVEDSTGANLSLNADGWVHCSDAPGHYFARVTIQLPIA